MSRRRPDHSADMTSRRDQRRLRSRRRRRRVVRGFAKTVFWTLVLAAVFISNFPESLSSATGMRRAGRPAGRVIWTWVVVLLVSALSSALGYGLLDGASGNLVGGIQAFAAGAVLTMLADTMMPEAFDFGGKAVGLVTVLGFALAYLLSTLE